MIYFLQKLLRMLGSEHRYESDYEEEEENEQQILKYKDNLA